MSIKALYYLLIIAGTTSITHAAGPVVTSLVWGTITVKNPDQSVHTYKDCKLSPLGSQAWDWGLTGTRHFPGIQIGDFSDFINAVDIVILSRGMDLMLNVQDNTIAFLKSNKKEYYLLQSKEAVELYNKLVTEGKKVGALIHSTC